MASSGRSATVEEFVSTLQRAVSCLTPAVLIISRADAASPFFVRFPQRLIPLQGRDRLMLSALHTYDERSAVVTGRASVARSLGYWYQIHHRDGSEVIAFHWHPGPPTPVPFPHLHVDARSAAPAFDRRRHVPTGRVSLEAVVRFAITELDVRPQRSDWERVVADGIASFDGDRSW